jgi:hypothetical protein
MKRIRLLILLSVLAVALPVGLLSGVAKAGGSGTSGSGTSVSISQTADYNIGGVSLDVNLLVRCTGGIGLAKVTVNQPHPETGFPATTGEGFNPDVVCDGRTHSVGVTLIGAVYDPGRAYAIADVTAPSGPAHAEKWITIHVN